MRSVVSGDDLRRFQSPAAATVVTCEDAALEVLPGASGRRPRRRYTRLMVDPAGSLSTIFDSSLEGLRLATASHAAAWGFGTEESWGLDQERGLVNFWFEDERIVQAHAQIIGTYNTDDATFLWAWDHDGVEEPLRRDAIRVREWAEKNGHTSLLSRKVTCEEATAWAFTALAMRLASASGAYRGTLEDGPLVFMTFGTVKITPGG